MSGWRETQKERETLTGGFEEAGKKNFIHDGGSERF